jgi:hypothetical protein
MRFYWDDDVNISGHQARYGPSTPDRDSTAATVSLTKLLRVAFDVIRQAPPILWPD